MLAIDLIHRLGETHLFEVEEDRIEAKEHKGNRRSEPAESWILKRIGIDPCPEFGPTLWLVVFVLWVRCAENERVNASHRRERGNVAYGVIEADRFDQVAEHAWVDHACYTGTASNVAYSQASAFGEPCRSN
jgi:hypothetical protein